MQGLRFFIVVMISFVLVSCSGGSYTAPPNTSNKTAHRIHQLALPKYAQLARESWPPISVHTLPLKIGVHSSSVAQIRERLYKLGDAYSAESANPDYFDASLAGAVKRFQFRHGLKSDGEIGEKTLQALNVTPRQRLNQLKVSMHRWAKFPEDEGSHYIRVNIPAYDFDLIRDGHEVLNMKVIVGKSSRPTPELYSKVRTMVFNPTWNVPRSITKKDIIPKILKNPNYLAENNIDIYSSWAKGAYKIDPKSIDWQKAHEQGFPYRFTQRPGINNALGQVKFIFMNEHDVYLHDTPQKGLFNQVRRAYSSGCIRLEKPFHLVEYFMQQDPELTYDKVNDIMQQGQLKYIRIKNPIPIYITYITAWVDQRGLIHFREDIYQHD